MFDRIVIGVDDREGGRDALALADSIARGTAATLIAVRAYLYEGLRADASSELDSVLREEGVAAQRVIVGDTSVARALQHAAEEENAGLLVVGSTHRGHVGRVLAGGVTASVLHHAPCPVAVAPRGFAEDRRELATIGVGFDGSAESQAALAIATELAKAVGASLRILSVVPIAVPVAYPVGFERDWVDEREREGRAEVDRARAAAGERGVAASGDTAVGSAVDELVELSREVDLLVVGSRGFGPVKRLLLGSTSDRLVREAACPVIAVPRPEHAD